MFLRRVTITGFKSFANKTVIELEPGITGIVGPNGSGKSNIADAIRWAMGEQGKNRLRLGDRDEVVFAGTDKRARASYAEVVLLFDNEDGAFAADMTEVEISRRLYRSSETDYRLAGRSVRLAEIQALLASAGVGASSYAVIGQGMIDSILMSSPAERKLLFEEAAGIRGAELGREAAMRKLTATALNLTRLRDIASELSPQLGTLKKAVGAADERQHLADKVLDLRAALSVAGHAHWTSLADSAVDRLKSFQDKENILRQELKELEISRARLEDSENELAERQQALHSSLSSLEHERDQAATDLENRRTALATAKQSEVTAQNLAAELSDATDELTKAQIHLVDLSEQLKSNQEAANLAAKAVDRATREVAVAQAALVAIREGTGDDARTKYLDHALEILKTLAMGLGTPEYTHDRVRLLVHKAGRLLSHATKGGAAELLTELKTSQKQLEAAMTKKSIAIEHQTNTSIAVRSLEIDIAHLQTDIERLNLRHTQINTQLDLARKETSASVDLQKAVAHADKILHDLTTKLETQRNNLSAMSSRREDHAFATELFANIEKTKSALLGLESDRAQAIHDHSESTQELDRVVRQAEEWGVSVNGQAVREEIAAISDQLARAEALLEARTQMYEDHVHQYEQATHRQGELESQIADLEVAEADLRTLVSELDVLIRSRFKENFIALAEQFRVYFGRLFEGGTASLDLAEDAEDGYGIIIKASPKGKRLTTIAALSGGERALAGVALVAAIMRVNPSPFVVLDEIDAALDEINSGKLAGILTELQEYSQLIVITHNRQTMKAAKVLFGVTINEHHISHMISMRLEEATKLAARG